MVFALRDDARSKESRDYIQKEVSHNGRNCFPHDILLRSVSWHGNISQFMKQRISSKYAQYLVVATYNTNVKDFPKKFHPRHGWYKWKDPYAYVLHYPPGK